MDCLINWEQTWIALTCLPLHRAFLLLASLPYIFPQCQHWHQCSVLKLLSPWGCLLSSTSAMVYFYDFFFISTGLSVYHRDLPFVDIPFEVWLLIRHKSAIQRRLQHFWGAIQALSAEKPAGQTVNFLTAEWVMVYSGFRPQWGLTVLLCNIGSNFCGLIKSCVSLWKWL